MIYKLFLASGGFSSAAGSMHMFAANIATFMARPNVIAVHIEDPSTPDDQVGEYYELWSRDKGFNEETIKAFDLEVHVHSLR